MALILFRKDQTTGPINSIIQWGVQNKYSKSKTTDTTSVMLRDVPTERCAWFLFAFHCLLFCDMDSWKNRSSFHAQWQCKKSCDVLFNFTQPLIIYPRVRSSASKESHLHRRPTLSPSFYQLGSYYAEPAVTIEKKWEVSGLFSFITSW